ncbi:hypothetical protein D3C85_1144870 [compost metagenome]
MAHDVVWLADKFVARKAADFDESGVRIDDAALAVGARDQILILAQLGFHISDG